ncbi:MAG: alpha-ketoacid dehydrogenase subunit beta, partial [Deinococcus sp.]|nr:alpha-ketoacid dehydrogenase subunit beta [Deinococcus sp.]
LKLVDEALRAAELLEQEGISVEVFDPRTLVPLDLEGIINSVRKTGHLVIAHEAVRRCGPGAEIAALVAEEAWDALKGPMVRVAAENVPVPYAPELEKRVLPDAQRVVQGVCRALAATGQRQVVEV